MSGSPNKPQLLVLDGGLGTTLEDVFHRDISHALWSAKPIDEDPEVIIAAHLAFLRAGANVILTSTYQCAYNTFERAGYTREDARRIMLKSVKLANEAKHRFLAELAEKTEHGDEEDAPPPHDVKIALSLGPFGATLSPAQEFDGFYPPPFGPNLSSSERRTNAFEDTPEGRSQEQAAIDALTAFHHERLSIFADDGEAWDAIDFVAFETVPLRREVYAIRQTIARFQEKRRADGLERLVRMKPWWISTDYPDGQFPEVTPNGRHLTVREVASAALLEEKGGLPLGFGINCTGLEFLQQLLADASSVARESATLNGKKPWLVLYPNRGDVYNPETQSWSTKGREGVKWAEVLRAVVVENLRSGNWEGLIVGGCCKTGPAEIAGLVEELQAWGVPKDLDVI